MSILPDTAADGDQADAHPNVGKQADRALHGVGNGEVGVLALIEPADEKDAAAKSDQLHDALHESEVAYDLGAMKRQPDQRRGTFVEGRWRRSEEHTSELQSLAYLV